MTTSSTSACALELLVVGAALCRDFPMGAGSGFYFSKHVRPFSHPVLAETLKLIGASKIDSFSLSAISSNGGFFFLSLAPD